MLFLICVSSLVLLHQEVASVKVQTEQGWLQGQQLELMTKDGTYFSFKGIPYAKPPLGKLRFKAPQPSVPWEGVRNATEHGSECIQYDIFANKLIPGSEDCLFLNVYTPNINPKKPLPVMFFIHGGGFESGSGNVDNYGPDFLVQEDVILVTINYRLEVLGFLSLDTKEVPSNAGLKDQVAALKWVKKNIDKFGGDPENITVFGQSAGGVSVVLHMLSPMSKGLFTKAIAMSGVPSCDWSIDYQHRRRGFVLGKQFGLKTYNATELYEFLLNLPAEKLINVSPTVLASEEIIGNIIKMFHFVPVVEKDFDEDHFLTENPEQTLREGKVKKVELMIGHTSEEVIGDLVALEDTIFKTYSHYAELVVPRKILYRNSPNEILQISNMILKHYFGKKQISKKTIREFLTYLNDSTYNYDIYRYVEMLRKVLDKNIFVYKFSQVSKRNLYGNVGAKYNITGASHLDDTLYLFDAKQANLTFNKNTREYKMVQEATTLFTNFAKYGNPTPDSSLGTKWLPYNNVTEVYFNIGETLSTGKGLDAEVATFWKTVFDKAGLEF